MAPESPHPRWSRRTALRLGAASLTAGLSGCQAFARFSSPSLSTHWQHQLYEPVIDNPALGDERGNNLVYIATDTAVYGLSPGDGTQAWRSPGRSRIATAPGTLFTWHDMTLHAISTDTHQPRWQFERVRTMPLVAADLAFVSQAGTPSTNDSETTAGGLHAMPLLKKTPKWTVQPAGAAMPTVVTDDAVIAGVTDDQSDTPDSLRAYALADGHERWRFEPAPSHPHAQLAGDTLVVGSRGSRDETPRIFGIGPSDGSERWQVEIPGHTVYPRAATANRVFINAFGKTHRMHVLDAATGAKQWQGPGVLVHRDSDHLYLVRDDTSLAAVDSTDGTGQ